MTIMEKYAVFLKFQSENDVRVKHRFWTKLS